MRIAIVGSGGVGSYYGAMLARAGADVAFIARGAHLEALRAAGLSVKTPRAGEFTVRARATDDPREIGPVDAALFCVKTYDTDAAAAAMRPLVGPDTVVWPLQNGVESPERIGAIVGAEHLIGGTTYMSSRLVAPGRAEAPWDHRAYLGELDRRRSERVERLHGTLERAEVGVEIAPDIRVAMWSKLLGVSAVSAVCCTTRLPIGAILSCAETAELLWGAVDEGIAVARADGVALPGSVLDQMRAVVAGIGPTVRASMYHDLAAGKPLELDDMIGVIVRVGRRHGVATPLTFAMYAALKPYAGGAPAKL